MKKLLLTLGSAAAVVAPVATVVACGETSSLTLTGSRDVADGHLTLSGFVGPTYTEDEDEKDIIDRLITFGNRMGIELVAAGSDVTKVTLDGELAAGSGELEAVNHTHDLAALGYTNLGEFIAMFESEAGDETASGLAFQALSNSYLDDISGGGDTDTTPTTPAEVEAVITAIGNLDVMSGHTDANAWTDGDKAMDATEADAKFGIDAAGFAEIQAAATAADIQFVEIINDSGTLNVTVQYMGADKYDAVLQGLTFTTTP